MSNSDDFKLQIAEQKSQVLEDLLPIAYLTNIFISLASCEGGFANMVSNGKWLSWSRVESKQFDSAKNTEPVKYKNKKYCLAVWAFGTEQSRSKVSFL